MQDLPCPFQLIFNNILLTILGERNIMSSETVNLQIGNDVIRPILDAKIKALMLEVFDKDELLNKFIDRVLYDKVDEHGKKSNYNSDNKYDWIDIHLNKHVKTAVEEAVKEWTKENADKMKIAIKKAMSTKKNFDIVLKKILQNATTMVDKNSFSISEFDFFK
jgi:hypothetical protein